jgi:hypothetical protein
MADRSGIFARKLGIWLAASLAIFVAGFFVLSAWSYQLAAMPIVGYAFIAIWLLSGFVIAMVPAVLIVRLFSGAGR